jgi:uncharacterized RDD family membrane protein YckC
VTATAVAAPAAKLDAPDLEGYPKFLRPAVAAPGVYYAGFWVRLGVNLIDSAIQALIYLIVSYVVSALVGIVAAIAHFDSNSASTPVAIASLLAVYVYYNTVLVARHAASPGMRLCSMRIVRDADITTAPDRRTLHMRGILWILFSVTGFLRVIDALFIVFDARKRSLHDLIVGTAVVRKAPTPPKLASLLCSVCGRPVDEGTLCPRHGGSVGLTITLSGHTVSLQVAASVLALVGVVGVIVGIVAMIGGHVVGAAAIVAGLALLRITMALTQLRSWARWVGFGVALLIALGGAAAGLIALLRSNSAGGFLLAGGAVGALVAGCLWTPETYRSFRRVP